MFTSFSSFTSKSVANPNFSIIAFDVSSISFKFLVTKINLDFLEGCIFWTVLKFLIPTIISFNSSIASSSFSKDHSLLYSGHFEIIMLSSLWYSFINISSVINGITGCNNFNEFINTLFNVHKHASFVLQFSSYKRGFTISIYQSQNSFQMKSYIFWSATPIS